MAVINQASLELSLARDSRSKTRQYPLENYAPIRSLYAQLGTVPGALYAAKSPAVQMQAGDAGSTVDLMHLPYSRVRLLPYRSVLRTSIASGKVTFGIRQYTTQPHNTVVAQDADVFTGGAGGVTLSAAAAATPIAAGTLMDFNIWSYQGVTLFATFSAAVTAADWLEFRADLLAV